MPGILQLLSLILGLQLTVSPLAVSHSRNLTTSSLSQTTPPASVQASSPLPPSGEVVRRELGRKAVHRFSLELNAGQYARIVVSRRGIDLVVRTYGPDGHRLVEAWNPAGIQERITVSIVAATTGVYGLELSPVETIPAPGSYEISVAEIRVAAEADKDRVMAQEVYSDARQDRQRSALPKYADALKRWEALGDSFEVANTFHSLGGFYKNLPEFIAAVENYNKALSLRQQQNDRAGEAQVVIDLAAAYRDLGKPKEARQFYEQSLEIFRALGNRLGEASALYGLGFCHALDSDMSTALKYYELGLIIRREQHDQIGEVRTLNAMGGAYDGMGEPFRAMDLYTQASSVWQSLGDRVNEANTRNNIGVLYATRGDWQQALDSYRFAIAVYREFGTEDPGIEKKKADTLDNIAIVYESLNDPEQALVSLNEALAIRKKLKQPRGEGFTEACIGYAYFLLGDLSESMKHYERATSLQTAADDPRKAQTFTVMGMIYAARNDPQKAKELYNKALAIQQNPQEQAITLDKMGQAYTRLGDVRNASETLSRALSIWQKIEDRNGEAITRHHLAVFQRSWDQLEIANQEIDRATSILESLRSNVVSQRSRMIYFSFNTDLYELAIDTKMELHKKEPLRGYDQSAFLLSEASRARSLRDSLSESRIDIRQGVDAQLLLREKDLQYRLTAKSDLRTRLTTRNGAAKQLADVVREIDALTFEYDGLLAEIKSHSPRYATLVTPRALSLIEIQQQLDGDTVLLEYSLGDKCSYVWVVTPDSIKGFELAGREEIEGVTRQLKGALTERNREAKGEQPEQRKARLDKAEAEYTKAAAILGRLVLEPVASFLGQKRLLVVADGALQLIPFGSLPAPRSTGPNAVTSGAVAAATSVKTRAPGGLESATPAKLLIEEHEIINLASASVLAVQRQELAKRPVAPHAVAVIANPVFNSDDPRVKAAARARERAAGTAPPKSEPGAVAQAPTANSSTQLSRLSQTNANETSPLMRALRDTGLENVFALPLSREEADAIMKVAPKGEGMEALDFKASRATAMSPELSKYRIIHFATHGVLDLEHPELSGMLLSMVDEKGRSQDGYLRLHDIYNLNLPAELVVLSACETGVGKQIKGEGLIALTRGFMYAGARNVVSSLWKVDDAATADLMTQFYKEMFTNKLKPAAALQQAQLTLAKSKRWRSPYYWAGFTIQGDWK